MKTGDKFWIQILFTLDDWFEMCHTPLTNQFKIFWGVSWLVCCLWNDVHMALNKDIFLISQCKILQLRLLLLGPHQIHDSWVGFSKYFISHYWLNTRQFLTKKWTAQLNGHHKWITYYTCEVGFLIHPYLHW